MTDRRPLETRLGRFLLEEAPAHAPADLIHDTRERVAATLQRGRLSTIAGRLAGSTASKLVLVAAGLVLVGGLAVGGVGSPSATTAPRSADPFTCPAVAGVGTCLGALSDGTYASTSFRPGFSFRSTAGWSNGTDTLGQFDLTYATGGQYRYPDGLVFHDGISFFRRPVGESSVTRAALDGVGTTADALTQWLVGHPDLVASVPTAASIGGATGFRLVLSLPTATRAAPDHCTTDHGESRCESLFLSSDPAATYGFGLVGPESVVAYLLDTPSGDTVLIVIDDVDGVDPERLTAAATPIVESVRFTP